MLTVLPDARAGSQGLKKGSIQHPRQYEEIIPVQDATWAVTSPARRKGHLGLFLAQPDAKASPQGLNKSILSYCPCDDTGPGARCYLGRHQPCQAQRPVICGDKSHCSHPLVNFLTADEERMWTH